MRHSTEVMGQEDRFEGDRQLTLRASQIRKIFSTANLSSGAAGEDLFDRVNEQLLHVPCLDVIGVGIAPQIERSVSSDEPRQYICPRLGAVRSRYAERNESWCLGATADPKMKRDARPAHVALMIE